MAKFDCDGVSYLLLSPLTSMGRDPEVDLCFDDDLMSRRHAVVADTRSGYLLIDLRSSNGVAVNGKRCETFLLQDGDTVTIGRHEFTFRSGHAPAAGEVTRESHASAPGLGDVCATQGFLESLASLHRQSDFESLADATLEVALDATGGDRAHLLLYEEGELEARGSRGREEGAVDLPPPGGTSAADIVERASTSREVFYSPDLLIHSPLRPTSGKPCIQLWNVCSVVCAPILAADEVLGVLWVDTRIQSDSIDKATCPLLAVVAAHFVVAFE